MRTMHRDARVWLDARLHHLPGRHSIGDAAGDDLSWKTGLSEEWLAHVDTLARALSTKTAAPFKKMAADVAKGNASGLKSLGIDVRAQLGSTLDDIQAANQDLMVRAGRAYAQDVADVLNDPNTWGLTNDEIAKLLADRADVSESRATLIARDQTAKTNAGINQTRQVAAGVSQYSWSGSLDERERETHLANEGKIFDWADPPAETGHPGDDIQCRCIAIPEIPDLDDDDTGGGDDEDSS